MIIFCNSVGNLRPLLNMTSLGFPTFIDTFQANSNNKRAIIREKMQYKCLVFQVAMQLPNYFI